MVVVVVLVVVVVVVVAEAKELLKVVVVKVVVVAVVKVAGVAIEVVAVVYLSRRQCARSHALQTVFHASCLQNSGCTYTHSCMHTYKRTYNKHIQQAYLVLKGN